MMQFNRRLLGGSGLLVLAALFIALVMLGSLLLRGARIDLTENRLYTLSEGSRAVIAKLDEPVNLYLFFSDSAAQDLPMLRTYAGRVRELLEEMQAVSGGKLRLEVIDPLPFSEAEDRAAGYGLQAVPLGNSGNSLYFGLAGTNSTDGQAAIPFFQPDKETFLEYDVIKLIASLSELERPVVGVLGALDMGPGFDPQMGGPREGWVIDGELRNLFTLRKLDNAITEIPPDVKLLFLLHPRGLSEDTLFAIDQFVLGGGRAVVVLDPLAESEQTAPGMDPAQAMVAAGASELGPLLKAWGVQFDPTQVVLDGENALQIQLGTGRAVRHPGVIGLTRDDLNQADVVTAQLARVNLSSAGHLEYTGDGRFETLAQSSASSMLTGAERLRFLPDPTQLFQGFEPSGARYTLAARLTAPLKTAFPGRREGQREASEGDANLLFFADSDFLTDRFWVQVQQFFGQRVVNSFADNGTLAVNAVDNLVGSADLIAVRARGSSARPFDTVEALRRQADDRFRVKEQELQQQLDETERQLAELQRAKGDDQALVLSDEQRAALERFQDEKLRIRKELRAVRAQLDADIQSLGARLKAINIAGVPILLSLAALGWAWVRRRRKEARA